MANAYRKSKKGSTYINKCENCGKTFQTKKACIRFHSPDCMKEYFEKKYGNNNEENNRIVTTIKC